MELRSVAFIGCRLLALYLAIQGIAGAPEAALSVLSMLRSSARVLAPLEPAFVPALLLIAAAGFWFGAAPLAVRLAGSESRRRLRKAEARSLERAVFIAAGLLVLAGGIGDALRLATELAPWFASHPHAAPPMPVIGLAAALLLRTTLGLCLIFGAEFLSRRLRAAPQLAGADADEPSTSRLLNELVGAAGTLGARRLADLAMSLKAEAESVAKRVVRSSLDAMIAAVQQRHHDFGAVSAADGTVTIAFSDMEGFTAMTQRLGDQAAHEVIKLHNQIVRRALKAHAGQEVELQGDGFLLAFPDTAQALRCAAAIQRACAEHSAGAGREPIRVRIGLHRGTPIQEGDRFFGITVILAARIAGQATGAEVLVSEAVHDAVRGSTEFSFAAVRVAELKGLSGRHRMHLLDWSADH